MKYISIDIETTGLNPEYCQVLEVGAIIDDFSKCQPIDQLPRFQVYLMHDRIVGEPYALSMHSAIFERMSRTNNGNFISVGGMRARSITWTDENDYSYVSVDDFWTHFIHWLQENDMSNGDINVAGKNFGSFDKQFLNKLPGWDRLGSRFRHRFLDPGMLYLQSEDTCVPDTKTCMERAGISGDVSHTALGDAEVVIQLLRHKLSNKFK